MSDRTPHGTPYVKPTKEELDRIHADLARIRSSGADTGFDWAERDYFQGTTAPGAPAPKPDK